MSSRPQTDHPRNDPHHATADAEAAATSSVIAKLRQQLRHQNILQHPAVSRELRKLEEQLTAQLTRTGQAGGRHRVTSATTSARPGAGPGREAPGPAALVPAPQVVR
jgi:hypothetical protein